MAAQVRVRVRRGYSVSALIYACAQAWVSALYLSIYPSIYLSIYLSIHLSIYLSIHLSIQDGGGQFGIGVTDAGLVTESCVLNINPNPYPYP